MKAKRPRARKSPVKRKRRPPPVPPSLLILACDPKKLAADSITLAADTCATLRTFMPAVRCDLVEASTESSLLAEFARLSECGVRYDVILVVGHSNRDVLALAPDATPTWKAAANWLGPFAPRVILIAGCEAGRRGAAQALFEGIASLREVYGSPMAAIAAQFQIYRYLLGYLLAGGKLDANDRLVGQAINAALTGGLIFHYTRKDFIRPDPLKAAVHAGLEMAIDHTRKA